jgi:hypothetical protein
MPDTITYGPPELRIRWEPDPEPYDIGDIDNAEDREAEVWAYVDLHGVYGCTVELRRPACACCGRTDWEIGASLWGIVGDDGYHREIERELMAEAL